MPVSVVSIPYSCPLNSPSNHHISIPILPPLHFLLLRLAPRLRSWPTTLDSPRLGPVDVMRRDPLLVVPFCCFRSGGYGRPIRHHGHLVSWIDLLGTAAGLLGAGGGGAGFGGEVGGDPDLIGRVDYAAEDGEDEKVEEDAAEIWLNI